jgi:uncharacterized protein
MRDRVSPVRDHGQPENRVCRYPEQGKAARARVSPEAPGWLSQRLQHHRPARRRRAHLRRGGSRAGQGILTRSQQEMPKRFVVAAIRLYKRYVSPFLGNACRFHPTCSTYSIDAVQRYGVIRGLAKGAFRILRCNPFHPGGFDPVGQETSWKKER